MYESDFCSTGFGGVENRKMRWFCSILPDLEDEAGHSYEYTICVAKAVQEHGWKHSAWVSENCKIGNLPERWEKNLRKSWLFWDYFQAIRRLPQNICLIFFFENAGLKNAVLFCLALLLLRRKASLWLMHRYAPIQMRGKGRFHAWFLMLFAKKMNIELFTDSELLLLQQQKRFGKGVHLLPIPHAPTPVEKRIQGEWITCWWPGGQIRPAKGLSYIREISKALKNGQTNIRLIVAAKAQSVGVEPSDRVLFIEDELSRKDYERWMSSACIVLLPYDPSVYHSGTSGIFVEAVVASAMPIVREGTWMAHELRKYGLQELIIDWEGNGVLNQLGALYANPRLHEKLALMQSAYQEHHSLANFSRSLGDLLKRF